MRKHHIAFLGCQKSGTVSPVALGKWGQGMNWFTKDVSRRGKAKAAAATATTVAMVALGLASPVLAAGTPGDLDTGFGSGGLVKVAPESKVGKVLALADGKVVTIGASNVGGIGGFALTRHLTNGALDPTFGSAGSVRTAIGSGNAIARSGVLQADGKIVVAGSAEVGGAGTDVWQIVVARYLSTGALDASFGAGGVVVTSLGAGRSDEAFDVALGPDSKIVVTGSPNGTSDPATILRYNLNGALDATFGAGGVVAADLFTGADAIDGVAVQGDGKVVIVANGSSDLGDRGQILARYGANGALDATFNGGKVTLGLGATDGRVEDLVVQPDSKIVVVGTSQTGASFVVRRFNANGTVDSSFGVAGVASGPAPAFVGGALSVALQANQKIVAAGFKNQSAAGNDQPNLDTALVRYLANGTLDTGFGAGGVATSDLSGSSGVDAGLAVALQPDGKIVTADVSTIARFEGDGIAGAPAQAPPVIPPVVGGAGAERPNRKGYRLVASDGGIFAFGSSLFYGSAATTPGLFVTASAPTPTDAGYWMATADGRVFAFGDATHYGSASNLNKPIIGLTPTPSGKGYWLVATDGGIFAFGDAAFFGSTGAMTLNQRIVAMASTPTGLGYWLIAADGGIFSYGDAAFFGSTGAMTLNKPVVAGMSTPTGNGYWLAASDGGIFAFGDAAFFGSTGAMTLNKPIVGAAATASGKGYHLVASDGGIFAFGDAAFFGSTGAMTLNKAIVGIG